MIRRFSLTLGAALLSATLGLTAVQAQPELPELGTVASSTLSIDKESQIGDFYMRMLRGQLPIIHDPVMNEYLNDLGNRLVARADNVKTPFTFFLINNNEINAFAFFGGHVGVHTAILNEADNESELASVLGHEIAHVTQRHLARAIEAQRKTAPATLAGVIGSIILAMASPEAGIAALQSTLALNQQAQINYTRSNEKEADRIGIKTLAAAGFDPGAVPSFFGKMAAKYRFASKPPQMLLTHPLPESRVADARARAALYPYRPVPENLLFHLAKARVQVRYSKLDRDHALFLFDKQAKMGDPVVIEAAHYGKALTLLDMERFDEAEKELNALLAESPQNLFYLDTAADILLMQKRPQEAIALLRQAQKLRPDNSVIEINLANVLLQTGQLKEARTLLEHQILLNKDSVVAYDLLSQVYRKMGLTAERHMVQAELLALSAGYGQAIEQLQYAYRQTKDNPLQKARIDARIKELRKSEQEMKSL
ncbi:M48 family metalloprotease [Ferrimonas futtsuensis]|uniref:beta-barrel assembly-enhancing protease n=1 Tax=Ferrimonas futtsuensis TaxID=364764 RepID=UPI0003FD12CF|nr:M48 family metalloprotease [Ferrimonas futtsuensis]